MQDSSTMYKAAHEGGSYGQFITTVKGGHFFFDKPVFDAEEIAHSLGNTCRYSGHSLRFFSTAEHSLLVSGLCEFLGLADPFEGLMHDGHEAYLVDMPSPWKAMLPDYKKFEKRLEAALRKQYNLSPTVSDGCKQADWLALAIESRTLLPTKGNDFLWPPGIREQANKLVDVKVNCFTPEVARSHFMVAFSELGGPRGFTS